MSYQQSSSSAYPASDAPPGFYAWNGNGAQQPQSAPQAGSHPQLQVAPRQQVLAPQLLPHGAVPFNGGVLYSENLFANSYRVPGPNGSDYVYYDKSVPMPPPPPTRPDLSGQWNSLTRWLKVFIILLFAYWCIQLTYHWRIGLCLPILFLPTYLLYREWRRHYRTVELYMLVKMWAIGFAPGALVVMIVETIVTAIFTLLCFQSYIAEWIESAQLGKTPAPTDQKDNGDAPDGMEFLNFPETPALFIFLFLLSYVSAGCCEESLKYWSTNRIKKKYRPAYAYMHGLCLYAVAAALGFSTVENIGYVLQGAYVKGGETSFSGVLVNALGRTFISTPLHLATGYLIGLQVVRRDILGESLGIVRVMGWSVFFHGTFDFGLFVIMALSSHWSTGPDDVAVSYVLMACVVVLCYAGLAYRIWRTRQIVFPRGIASAIEEEEAVAAAAAPGPDLEAGQAQPRAQPQPHAQLRDLEAPPSPSMLATPSGHGARIDRNGFERLRETPL